jgi:proteasome assembly chaperone (PAC2) family protein
MIYHVLCGGIMELNSLDFFNAKSDDGPIVIVIKHAQIKEPQGQYDLCISNAFAIKV